MRLLDRLSTAEGLLQLAERVVKVAPIVAGAVVSGGAGAWTIMAVNAFSAYSPASWYFGGLLGAFLFSLTVWLWSGFRLRIAKASLYSRSMPPLGVNPLDAVFTKVRIPVGALAEPVTRVINDKTFVQCDLSGPEVLLLSGCRFDGLPKFVECDFVALRDDRTQLPFRNIVKMTNCTIKQCQLFNLVLLVNKGTADDLDQHAGGQIIWLSKR